MKNTSFAAFLTLLSSIASAEITVQDPWVRGTVPQQQATGAFMRISTTTDVRLIAAQSPVARAAEVHEMTMEDNVMRMRESSGIDVAAGKTVDLKPGSYHLMLLGLKQQIKEGDQVPIRLVFEEQGKPQRNVDIMAQGRPLNSSSKPQAPR